MKKLFLLIMLIVIVFAQDRVQKEKVSDLANMSKNAWHDIERGSVHGVKYTDEQISRFYVISDSCDQEIVRLLTGADKIEPVDPAVAIVNELVNGADKYFWKGPRVESVAMLQGALVGDMSGAQYLIDNARTRIYIDYREYVIGQLNLLIGG